MSPLTREHVVWAYRLFLDREPENDQVVEERIGSLESTSQLRLDLMASDEFRANNPGIVLDPHWVNRSGWAKADGLPVPPPDLRMLSAGRVDEGWFLESGARAALAIEEAAARQRRPLASLDGVLDFGCGCGRVLRHLRAARIGRLLGRDSCAEAVDWCRANLWFVSARRSGAEPPLDLPDAGLDLAYALSVFTRLTEPLQNAWMRELARVLRPGGLLILSTHGLRYFTELDAEQRRRFAAGQLVVRNEELAGSNACGAFHPEEYLRQTLAPASGFRVVEFRPEGALGNPSQDLYVLQKV